MTPQVFARRLTLIVTVVLAVPPTTSFAADPSPRRQAELDAMVIRRQAQRQKKTRTAAAHAAERAFWISAARAYEMEVAQNLAFAQRASAQRESQWIQFERAESSRRSVLCQTAYQPVCSYPPPVIVAIYPQFSTYTPEPSRSHESTQPTTGPGAGHMVLMHR
jgi:hypothetical protein